MITNILCYGDKLLYGAAYYDEYMPYERLGKDIEMMKKAGMNVVRIGESTWSTLEPQDGVFDFRHLDAVLDSMADAGISVILGTPTYAVPTWMVKSYPEVLATTDNGRGIYGPRQIMDITNPVYLFYAERVIRKMMEHCVSHRAVIGVQIDNETKAYGTAGDNVQEGFKKYMRSKYEALLNDNPGLLDVIPERSRGIAEDNILDYINYELGLDYWSNRINAWEDFPDVRGTINASFKGEFRKYQRKLVTDFLKWQSEIVREYLSEDQFVTHNTDYDWRGYSYGINKDTDACETAGALDIVGTDIYHPSQTELTGLEIAFGGDVSRSLKGDNYYVLETEAQGFPGWTPYKGQLRLQAYAHFANGADMVEYWHWHSLHNAIETYWKGVLSHDFKENDTYREASVVGNELKMIESHLIHLKKNNKTAVLVSQESLTALESFPIDEKGELRYNDVLMKVYKQLYELNIECDFIWPQQIDKIYDYDLLIIPAMYSMSDDVAVKIDTFIKKGGHAFMTYKSAFTDENVKVYSDEAPHGLAKAFGISYSHFIWPKDISFISERYGNTQCKHFAEYVNPEGAQILAGYDRVDIDQYAALTRNLYGKGVAIYLACDVDDSVLKDILKDAAIGAGAYDESEFTYPIVHRKGINVNGRTIHYIMNFSDSEKTVALPFSGTSLLEDEAVTKDRICNIEPWNLIIVEQN